MMYSPLPGVLASLALLLFAVVMITMLGAFGDRRGLRPLTLAMLALVLPALLLLPSKGVALGGMLSLDAFTAFFMALFVLVAIVTVLGLETPSPAALASVCLSVVGMTLAAGARDLILLYLAIELTNAPLFALIALKKTPRRLEAATKYFIVSIVSSALLLLGVVLLAVPLGTTSIPAIAGALAHGSLALLGAGFFLAGLAFKLGAWPFNLWVPDVYSLGPAEVSGFLAGTTKKAAFAALLRVAVVLTAAVADRMLLFAVLAALTMTIPNLIALAQDDARRLAAYSIMTHAGYLLMGVAAASAAGAAALSLHALAHATLAAGALLCLGVFAANGLHRVEDLSGMGRRHPFLAASLTVFLLGLTGMPLVSGFWSKLYLFVATLDAGLAWLVALAVVNSAIALYYYFRIIRAMYGRENAGRTIHARRGVLWAVGICLVLALLVGLWPAPFLRAATVAAGALG